jgi:glucose/arabinose dehydrogenase
VRKGGNHGWPAHLGVSAEHAIASPVILFKDRPVPPGGLAFVPPTAGPSANDLLMTSLGAQELHRYVIGADHTLARFERWWPDRFGRLRGITVARDGTVYVGTSNRDGRALGAYPPTDFVYRLRWIKG